MTLLRYAQRLVTDTFNECISETKIESKKTALKNKLSQIAPINNLQGIIQALNNSLISDILFGRSIDQKNNAFFDRLSGNQVTNTRARLTHLNNRLIQLSGYNGELSNNAFILIRTVFEQCITTTDSAQKKASLIEMAQRLYGLNDPKALNTLRTELNPVRPFGASIDRQTSRIFRTNVTNTRTQMNQLVINLNALSGPQFDNTKDWMSRINNQVTLRELTMPGSHDAGVYNDPTDPANKPEWRNIGVNLSLGVCHSLSIYNQARAGVRYFDIRISKYDTNQWRASHDLLGNGVWGANSHKILDDMTQFLDENPSEVIFYKISDHTDDKNYIEMMMRRLSRYLYTNNNNVANANNLPNITLGAVRGKVILLIENKSNFQSWHLENAPEPFIQKGYFPFNGKKGDTVNQPVTADDGLVIWGGNNGKNIPSMIKGQLRKATEHAQHTQQGLTNIFFQMSWTQMGGNVIANANAAIGPHSLIPALLARLEGATQAVVNGLIPAAAERDDLDAFYHRDIHTALPLPPDNIKAYPNFLHMDDSKEATSTLIIGLNQHLPANQAQDDDWVYQGLQEFFN